MDVARHRRRYPSTPAVVGSADTVTSDVLHCDYAGYVPFVTWVAV